MGRKILAHSVSTIIGTMLAYYSTHFPILPQDWTWGFVFTNYWWLMLIFFVIGYGITFGIFYFLNKNK